MSRFFNYLVKENINLPPDYYLKQSLDMCVPFLNKRYSQDTLFFNLKILKTGLEMAEVLGNIEHKELINQKIKLWKDAIC
jgi:hypothetical protein